MRGFVPAFVALAVSFVAGVGCGGSERGGTTPSGGTDNGSNLAGSAGTPAAAGNSAGAGSSGGGQSAGSGAGGASSVAGGAGEAAGGSASGGSASGDLVDCDTRKVICKRVLPECPAMQVPSVVGTCYGECVKIDTCACSSAEQCPDAEQYTCWGKMHCGPYVR